MLPNLLLGTRQPRSKESRSQHAEAGSPTVDNHLPTSTPSWGCHEDGTGPSLGRAHTGRRRRLAAQLSTVFQGIGGTPVGFPQESSSSRLLVAGPGSQTLDPQVKWLSSGRHSPGDCMFCPSQALWLDSRGHHRRPFMLTDVPTHFQKQRNQFSWFSWTRTASLFPRAREQARGGSPPAGRSWPPAGTGQHAPRVLRLSCSIPEQNSTLGGLKCSKRTVK